MTSIFTVIFSIVKKRLNLEKTFMIGIIVVALANLPFAFAEEVHNAGLFFAICMLSRIMQGIGFVGVQNIAFLIATKEYSSNLMTFIGMLEMALAFGMSAGPTYGGIVYDSFGYKWPFFGLLIAMLLLLIPGYFLMLRKPTNNQTVDDGDEGPPSTVLQLIKIPGIIFAVMCVFISVACVTYPEVCLSPHITSKFKLSHSVAGLIMFLCPGIYALTTPLIGYILDKKDLSLQFAAIGMILGIFSFLFLGPAPFLGIKGTVWLLCVSWSVCGIFVAFVYVPSFEMAMKALRSKNLSVNQANKSMVSDIFLFATNIGYFAGPLTAGFIFQEFKFEWSCFPYVCLISTLLLLLIFYYVSKNISQICKPSEEKNRLIPDDPSVQYESVYEHI